MNETLSSSFPRSNNTSSLRPFSSHFSSPPFSYSRRSVRPSSRRTSVRSSVSPPARQSSTAIAARSFYSSSSSSPPSFSVGYSPPIGVGVSKISHPSHYLLGDQMDDSSGFWEIFSDFVSRHEERVEEALHVGFFSTMIGGGGGGGRKGWGGGKVAASATFSSSYVDAAKGFTSPCLLCVPSGQLNDENLWASAGLHYQLEKFNQLFMNQTNSRLEDWGRTGTVGDVAGMLARHAVQISLQKVLNILLKNSSAPPLPSSSSAEGRGGAIGEQNPQVVGITTTSSRFDETHNYAASTSTDPLSRIPPSCAAANSIFDIPLLGDTLSVYPAVPPFPSSFCIKGPCGEGNAIPFNCSDNTYATNLVASSAHVDVVGNSGSPIMGVLGHWDHAAPISLGAAGPSSFHHNHNSPPSPFSFPYAKESVHTDRIESALGTLEEILRILLSSGHRLLSSLTEAVTISGGLYKFVHVTGTGLVSSCSSPPVGGSRSGGGGGSCGIGKRTKKEDECFQKNVINTNNLPTSSPSLSSSPVILSPRSTLDKSNHLNQNNASRFNSNNIQDRSSSSSSLSFASSLFSPLSSSWITCEPPPLLYGCRFLQHAVFPCLVYLTSLTNTISPESTFQISSSGQVAILKLLMKLWPLILRLSLRSLLFLRQIGTNAGCSDDENLHPLVEFCLGVVSLSGHFLLWFLNSSSPLSQIEDLNGENIETLHLPSLLLGGARYLPAAPGHALKPVESSLRSIVLMLLDCSARHSDGFMVNHFSLPRSVSDFINATHPNNLSSSFVPPPSPSPTPPPPPPPPPSHSSHHLSPGFPHDHSTTSSSTSVATFSSLSINQPQLLGDVFSQPPSPAISAAPKPSVWIVDNNFTPSPLHGSMPPQVHHRGVIIGQSSSYSSSSSVNMNSFSSASRPSSYPLGATSFVEKLLEGSVDAAQSLGAEWRVFLPNTVGVQRAMTAALLHLLGYEGDPSSSLSSPPTTTTTLTEDDASSSSSHSSFRSSQVRGGYSKTSNHYDGASGVGPPSSLLLSSSSFSSATSSSSVFRMGLLSQSFGMPRGISSMRSCSDDLLEQRRQISVACQLARKACVQLLADLQRRSAKAPPPSLSSASSSNSSMKLSASEDINLNSSSSSGSDYKEVAVEDDDITDSSALRATINTTKTMLNASEHRQIIHKLIVRRCRWLLSVCPRGLCGPSGLAATQGLDESLVSMRRSSFNAPLTTLRSSSSYTSHGSGAGESSLSFRPLLKSPTIAHTFLNPSFSVSGITVEQGGVLRRKVGACRISRSGVLRRSVTRNLDVLRKLLNHRRVTFDKHAVWARTVTNPDTEIASISVPVVMDQHAPPHPLPITTTMSYRGSLKKGGSGNNSATMIVDRAVPNHRNSVYGVNCSAAIENPLVGAMMSMKTSGYYQRGVGGGGAGAVVASASSPGLVVGGRERNNQYQLQESIRRGGGGGSTSSASPEKLLFDHEADILGHFLEFITEGPDIETAEKALRIEQLASVCRYVTLRSLKALVLAGICGKIPSVRSFGRKRARGNWELSTSRTNGEETEGGEENAGEEKEGKGVDGVRKTTYENTEVHHHHHLHQNRVGEEEEEDEDEGDRRSTHDYNSRGGDGSLFPPLLKCRRQICNASSAAADAAVFSSPSSIADYTPLSCGSSNLIEKENLQKSPTIVPHTTLLMRSVVSPRGGSESGRSSSSCHQLIANVSTNNVNTLHTSSSTTIKEARSISGEMSPSFLLTKESEGSCINSSNNSRSSSDTASSAAAIPSTSDLQVYDSWITAGGGGESYRMSHWPVILDLLVPSTGRGASKGAESFEPSALSIRYGGWMLLKFIHSTTVQLRGVKPVTPIKTTEGISNFWQLQPLSDALSVSMSELVRTICDWHLRSNRSLMSHLASPSPFGYYPVLPSDGLWMETALRFVSLHICLRTRPLDDCRYTVPLLYQMVSICHPVLHRLQRHDIQANSRWISDGPTGGGSDGSSFGGRDDEIIRRQSKRVVTLAKAITGVIIRRIEINLWSSSATHLTAVGYVVLERIITGKFLWIVYAQFRENAPPFSLPMQDLQSVQPLPEPSLHLRELRRLKGESSDASRLAWLLSGSPASEPDGREEVVSDVKLQPIFSNDVMANKSAESDFYRRGYILETSLFVGQKNIVANVWIKLSVLVYNKLNKDNEGSSPISASSSSRFYSESVDEEVLSDENEASSSSKLDVIGSEYSAAGERLRSQCWDMFRSALWAVLVSGETAPAMSPVDHLAMAAQQILGDGRGILPGNHLSSGTSSCFGAAGGIGGGEKVGMPVTTTGVGNVMSMSPSQNLNYQSNDYHSAAGAAVILQNSERRGLMEAVVKMVIGVLVKLATVLPVPAATATTTSLSTRNESREIGRGGRGGNYYWTTAMDSSAEFPSSSVVANYPSLEFSQKEIESTERFVTELLSILHNCVQCSPSAALVVLRLLLESQDLQPCHLRPMFHSSLIRSAFYKLLTDSIRQAPAAADPDNSSDRFGTKGGGGSGGRPFSYNAELEGGGFGGFPIFLNPQSPFISGFGNSALLHCLPPVVDVPTGGIVEAAEIYILKNTSADEFSISSALGVSDDAQQSQHAHRSLSSLSNIFTSRGSAGERGRGGGGGGGGRSSSSSPHASTQAQQDTPQNQMPRINIYSSSSSSSSFTLRTNCRRAAAASSTVSGGSGVECGSRGLRGDFSSTPNSPTHMRALLQNLPPVPAPPPPQPFDDLLRSHIFLLARSSPDFEAEVEGRELRVTRVQNLGGVVLCRVPLTFPALSVPSSQPQDIINFRLVSAGRFGVTVAPAECVFRSTSEVFDRNDVVGFRTNLSPPFAQRVFAAECLYEEGDLLDVKFNVEPLPNSEQQCLRTELMVSGESIGSVLEVYFENRTQIDQQERMNLVFVFQDIMTIMYDGPSFSLDYVCPNAEGEATSSDSLLGTPVEIFEEEPAEPEDEDLRTWREVRPLFSEAVQLYQALLLSDNRMLRCLKDEVISDITSYLQRSVIALNELSKMTQMQETLAVSVAIGGRGGEEVAGEGKQEIMIICHGGDMEGGGGGPDVGRGHTCDDICYDSASSPRSGQCLVPLLGAAVPDDSPSILSNENRILQSYDRSFSPTSNKSFGNSPQAASIDKRDSGGEGRGGGGGGGEKATVISAPVVAEFPEESQRILHHTFSLLAILGCDVEGEGSLVEIFRDDVLCWKGGDSRGDLSKPSDGSSGGGGKDYHGLPWLTGMSASRRSVAFGLTTSQCERLLVGLIQLVCCPTISEVLINLACSGPLPPATSPWVLWVKSVTVALGTKALLSCCLLIRNLLHLHPECMTDIRPDVLESYQTLLDFVQTFCLKSAGIDNFQQAESFFEEEQQQQQQHSTTTSHHCHSTTTSQNTPASRDVTCRFREAIEMTNNHRSSGSEMNDSSSGGEESRPLVTHPKKEEGDGVVEKTYVDIEDIALLCGIPKAIVHNVEITAPRIVAQPVISVKETSRLWRWIYVLMNLWRRKSGGVCGPVGQKGGSMNVCETVESRVFNYDGSATYSARRLANRLKETQATWILKKDVIDMLCAMAGLIPDEFATRLNSFNRTQLPAVDANFSSSSLEVTHSSASEVWMNIFRLFRICIYFISREKDDNLPDYWQAYRHQLDHGTHHFEVYNCINRESAIKDELFGWQRVFYRAASMWPDGLAKQRLLEMLQTETLFHLVGSVIQVVSNKSRTHQEPKYCALSPSVYVAHWLLDSFVRHPLCPGNLRRALIFPITWSSLFSLLVNGSNLPMKLGLDAARLTFWMVNGSSLQEGEIRSSSKTVIHDDNFMNSYYSGSSMSSSSFGETKDGGGDDGSARGRRSPRNTEKQSISIDEREELKMFSVDECSSEKYYSIFPCTSNRCIKVNSGRGRESSSSTGLPSEQLCLWQSVFECICYCGASVLDGMERSGHFKRETLDCFTSMSGYKQTNRQRLNTGLLSHYLASAAAVMKSRDTWNQLLWLPLSSVQYFRNHVTYLSIAERVANYNCVSPSMPKEILHASATATSSSTGTLGKEGEDKKNYNISSPSTLAEDEKTTTMTSPKENYYSRNISPSNYHGNENACWKLLTSTNGSPYECPSSPYTSHFVHSELSIPFDVEMTARVQVEGTVGRIKTGATVGGYLLISAANWQSVDSLSSPSSSFSSSSSMSMISSSSTAVEKMSDRSVVLVNFQTGKETEGEEDEGRKKEDDEALTRSTNNGASSQTTIMTSSLVTAATTSSSTSTSSSSSPSGLARGCSVVAKDRRRRNGRVWNRVSSKLLIASDRKFRHILHEIGERPPLTWGRVVMISPPAASLLSTKKKLKREDDFRVSPGGEAENEKEKTKEDEDFYGDENEAYKEEEEVKIQTRDNNEKRDCIELGVTMTSQTTIESQGRSLCVSSLALLRPNSRIIAWGEYKVVAGSSGSIIRWRLRLQHLQPENTKKEEMGVCSPPLPTNSSGGDGCVRRSTGMGEGMLSSSSVESTISMLPFLRIGVTNASYTPTTTTNATTSPPKGDWGEAEGGAAFWQLNRRRLESLGCWRSHRRWEEYGEVSDEAVESSPWGERLVSKLLKEGLVVVVTVRRSVVVWEIDGEEVARQYFLPDCREVLPVVSFDPPMSLSSFNGQMSSNFLFSVTFEDSTPLPFASPLSEVFYIFEPPPSLRRVGWQVQALMDDGEGFDEATKNDVDDDDEMSMFIQKSLHCTHNGAVVHLHSLPRYNNKNDSCSSGRSGERGGVAAMATSNDIHSSRHTNTNNSQWNSSNVSSSSSSSTIPLSSSSLSLASSLTSTSSSVLSAYSGSAQSCSVTLFSPYSAVTRSVQEASSFLSSSSCHPSWVIIPLDLRMRSGVVNLLSSEKNQKSCGRFNCGVCDSEFSMATEWKWLSSSCGRILNYPERHFISSSSSPPSSSLSSSSVSSCSTAAATTFTSLRSNLNLSGGEGGRSTRNARPLLTEVLRDVFVPPLFVSSPSSPSLRIPQAASLSSQAIMFGNNAAATREGGVEQMCRPCTHQHNPYNSQTFSSSCENENEDATFPLSVPHRSSHPSSFGGCSIGSPSSGSSNNNPNSIERILNGNSHCTGSNHYNTNVSTVDSRPLRTTNSSNVTVDAITTSASFPATGGISMLYGQSNMFSSGTAASAAARWSNDIGRGRSIERSSSFSSSSTDVFSNSRMAVHSFLSSSAATIPAITSLRGGEVVEESCGCRESVGNVKSKFKNKVDQPNLLGRPIGMDSIHPALPFSFGCRISNGVNTTKRMTGNMSGSAGMTTRSSTMSTTSLPSANSNNNVYSSSDGNYEDPVMIGIYWGPYRWMWLSDGRFVCPAEAPLCVDTNIKSINCDGQKLETGGTPRGNNNSRNNCSNYDHTSIKEIVISSPHISCYNEDDLVAIQFDPTLPALYFYKNDRYEFGFHFDFFYAIPPNKYCRARWSHNSAVCTSTDLLGSSASSHHSPTPPLLSSYSNFHHNCFQGFPPSSVSIGISSTCSAVSPSSSSSSEVSSPLHLRQHRNNAAAFPCTTTLMTSRSSSFTLPFPFPFPTSPSQQFSSSSAASPSASSPVRLFEKSCHLLLSKLYESILSNDVNSVETILIQYPSLLQPREINTEAPRDSSTDVNTNTSTVLLNTPYHRRQTTCDITFNSYAPFTSASAVSTPSLHSSCLLDEDDGTPPPLFPSSSSPMLSASSVSSSSSSSLLSLSPTQLEETPLRLACRLNREDIVRLLIEVGGVDPDGRDSPGGRGVTPLMAAAQSGHKRIVNLLVCVYGVDINKVDSKGYTALTRTLKWPQLPYEMREGSGRIIGRGGGKGERNESAKKSLASMVELLLRLGANLYIKNCNGQSPFSIASLASPELRSVVLRWKHTPMRCAGEGGKGGGIETGRGNSTTGGTSVCSLATACSSCSYSGRWAGLLANCSPVVGLSRPSPPPPPQPRLSASQVGAGGEGYRRRQPFSRVPLVSGSVDLSASASALSSANISSSCAPKANTVSEDLYESGGFSSFSSPRAVLEFLIIDGDFWGGVGEKNRLFEKNTNSCNGVVGSISSSNGEGNRNMKEKDKKNFSCPITSPSSFPVSFQPTENLSSRLSLAPFSPSSLSIVRLRHFIRQLLKVSYCTTADDDGSLTSPTSSEVNSVATIASRVKEQLSKASDVQGLAKLLASLVWTAKKCWELQTETQGNDERRRNKSMSRSRSGSSEKSGGSSETNRGGGSSGGVGSSEGINSGGTSSPSAAFDAQVVSCVTVAGFDVVGNRLCVESPSSNSNSSPPIHSPLRLTPTDTRNSSSSINSNSVVSSHSSNSHSNTSCTVNNTCNRTLFSLGTSFGASPPSSPPPPQSSSSMCFADWDGMSDHLDECKTLEELGLCLLDLEAVVSRLPFLAARWLLKRENWVSRLSEALGFSKCLGGLKGLQWIPRFDLLPPPYDPSFDSSTNYNDISSTLLLAGSPNKSMNTNKSNLNFTSVNGIASDIQSSSSTSSPSLSSSSFKTSLVLRTTLDSFILGGAGLWDISTNPSSSSSSCDFLPCPEISRFSFPFSPSILPSSSFLFPYSFPSLKCLGGQQRPKQESTAALSSSSSSSFHSTSASYTFSSFSTPTRPTTMTVDMTVRSVVSDEDRILGLTHCQWSVHLDTTLRQLADLFHGGRTSSSARVDVAEVLWKAKFTQSFAALLPDKSSEVWQRTDLSIEEAGDMARSFRKSVKNMLLNVKQSVGSPYAPTFSSSPDRFVIRPALLWSSISSFPPPSSSSSSSSQVIPYANISSSSSYSHSYSDPLVSSEEGELVRDDPVNIFVSKNDSPEVIVVPPMECFPSPSDQTLFELLVRGRLHLLNRINIMAFDVIPMVAAVYNSSSALLDEFGLLALKSTQRFFEGEYELRKWTFASTRQRQGREGVRLLPSSFYRKDDGNVGAGVAVSHNLSPHSSSPDTGGEWAKLRRRDEGGEGGGEEEGGGEVVVDQMDHWMNSTLINNCEQLMSDEATEEVDVASVEHQEEKETTTAAGTKTVTNPFRSRRRSTTTSRQSRKIVLQIGPADLPIEMSVYLFMRPLLMDVTIKSLWDKLLEKLVIPPTHQSVGISLKIDRGLAATAKNLMHTMWYQSTQQLLEPNPSKLRGRPSDRPFMVVFRGEGATDFGGPFQEFLSCVAREVMGQLADVPEKGLPTYSACIPCPNSTHIIGPNQDTIVLSPISSPYQPEPALYAGENIFGVLPMSSSSSGYSNSIVTSYPCPYFSPSSSSSTSSSVSSSVPTISTSPFDRSAGTSSTIPVGESLSSTSPSSSQFASASTIFPPMSPLLSTFREYSLSELERHSSLRSTSRMDGRLLSRGAENSWGGSSSAGGERNGGRRSSSSSSSSGFRGILAGSGGSGRGGGESSLFSSSSPRRQRNSCVSPSSAPVRRIENNGGPRRNSAGHTPQPTVTTGSVGLGLDRLTFGNSNGGGGGEFSSYSSSRPMTTSGEASASAAAGGGGEGMGGFPSRETWDRVELAMYECLGRIMGMCLMIASPLNISFNPLLWKKLVGTPLSLQDLNDADCVAVEMLRSLKMLEEEGPDAWDEEVRKKEEAIKRCYAKVRQSIGDLTFQTEDSHGSSFELVEGGSDIEVTAENLNVFIRLSERCRLLEGQMGLQHLLQGIEGIVPIGRLRLLFDHKKCIDVNIYRRYLESQEIGKRGKERTFFPFTSQGVFHYEW